MIPPSAPCDSVLPTCGHLPADHDADGCQLCGCEEYEEPGLERDLRELDNILLEPPAAPEGFILIDCDAEPRHWPLYTVDPTGYGAPCMYCAYDAEHKAHAGCEHSHHRAWRRWKLTRWALGWAYQFGWVRGFGVTYDAHCRGCVSTVLTGRRHKP